MPDDDEPAWLEAASFKIFAAAKTMCSFLWLPVVQSIKRKQYPARLIQ